MAVGRVSRLLFALSLVVYLATAGGSLTTTDAVVTFDVTRSIVEQHSVAMSGNLLGREAERGRDGRYYAPFGLAQSLYNVPFYVAARTLVRVTGIHVGKPDSLPKAFVALGQTLISAFIIVEIFRCAVLVTGDVAASALAAVTFGFASILWPYSRFGFNQPLACATLLACVRCAIAAVRLQRPTYLVVAGVWFAISLMTRHEMAVALVPIALWLWFDGAARTSVRVRRLVRFAPGVVAGAVAWLTYNALRFGNPFDTGYIGDPTPGFGSSIVHGTLALLVSPAASIFLYSPVAAGGVVGLVWLWRRDDRSIAALCVGLVVSFVLLYANMANWLGGRSYGSRYLVVVLPYFAIGWAALLAAMSARARRLAFGVVFLVGVVIQLPGVLVDYAKASQADANVASYTLAQRQWDWRAASLVVNARTALTAVPQNVAYLSGARHTPSVAVSADASDRSFSQQFSFSLDFWWLYLFYLHVLSRTAVVLIVAGFGAVTGALAAQLGRRIRHTEEAPD